jgi:hypothetical protein
MKPPDKPDIGSIAAYARALLKSSGATPEVALEGLVKVLENLRQTFLYTDEELKPITRLIFELSLRRHGYPVPL